MEQGDKYRGRRGDGGDKEGARGPEDGDEEEEKDRM